MLDGCFEDMYAYLVYIPGTYELLRLVACLFAGCLLNEGARESLLLAGDNFRGQHNTSPPLYKHENTRAEGAAGDPQVLLEPHKEEQTDGSVGEGV